MTSIHDWSCCVKALVLRGATLSEDGSLGRYSSSWIYEEMPPLFLICERFKALSFRDMGLENKRIISSGKDVRLIPWMGDKIVNTLSVLLTMGGYKADKFAGVVEIEGVKSSDVSGHLKSFSKDNRPTNAELAKLVKNKQTEKYDHLLPEELLNEDYGARAFDIDGTIDWIRKADNQGHI